MTWLGPGRQPALMLMRCLPDELDPGDMKQSPEEVAAHLSSSGLIYKSEECGRMEARPTPRTVSPGCNDPSWWRPIGKAVGGLLWKCIMVFFMKAKYILGNGWL